MEIKRCLKEYESNIESKVKNNPKAFFAYTKSLQKSNSLPVIMKYGDLITDNMKNTANSFASYFSTTYTDSSHYISIQCNNNCHTYFPLSEEDISTTILSLDQNKVHSPDEIPTIFYRNTINNITKPLLILFKSALSQMH